MKIIIVDNDPVFSKFAEKILKKEGHEVLSAQDGLGALDMLKSFSPDVFFIDYVMPNIDGKAFCQILRNHPDFKSTYIVLLSAIAAEEWTNLQDIGADVCIAKGPLDKMKKFILEVLKDPEKSIAYCAKGNVIGLENVYARLITKELLASKNHFQLLLNKMEEGIVELNAQNRIVLANPSAQRILNRTEGEVLGAPFLDVFPVDNITSFPASMGWKDQLLTLTGPDNMVVVDDQYLTIDAIPLPCEENHTLVIINDISDYKRTEHKLVDTNDFLASILNSSYSISIISTDIDQNILFWNKGAEGLFGYTAEEVVGKKKIDILYPGDDEKHLARGHRQLLQRDKKEISCELKETTKDGRELWMELHLSPRLSDTGEVVGILGIGEDITERKAVEESLLSSEERFRTLSGLAEEGILIHDMKGIVDANEALAKMFGYELSDIIGMRVKQLCSEECWKTVSKHIDAGNEDQFEGVGTRKDGATFSCLLASRSYQYRGRSLSVATVRDITVQKAAEEALLESKEKYRTVLAASQDPIVVYDTDGRVTYFNPAFTRVFGWTLEDRLGSKMDDFVPEDAWGETEQMIEKVLSGKKVTNFETRRYDNAGEAIFVNISASIYKDNEGKPSGCVVNLRDMSTRIKLEGQLRHAQKMESLGTLAGGVAHDFNNLLMGIQGRISLMKLDAEEGDPQLKHLNGIEAYIENAAVLTKQLLGFARGGKYELRATNLNELVRGQCQMFGRTRKDIIIHSTYDKRLGAVIADAAQVEQVLLDICVNAWQAMPGGGDLYVQTEQTEFDEIISEAYHVKPGKYAKITIRDTGIGMDAMTLERIFDPFFTTKEIGRGTGLGLASAYGIIQNHGGFIEAVSQKGKGSTFSIFLPVSKKGVVRKRSHLEKLIQGSETILLVDDEEMIIDVGYSMLETMGYSVLVAQSGKEALEIYKQNMARIDMVILDMIMPQMDGGEIYEMLKVINKEIKVLLSSGYSVEGQAAEILKMGCDGFIQKPFNMEALSKKIREILDPDDTP